MPRPVRRVRGTLLRLALRRWPAVGAGALCLALAVLVRQLDAGGEWVTGGLSLVLAATGIALLIGGLGGRRPDWIDPD